MSRFFNSIFGSKTEPVQQPKQITPLVSPETKHEDIKPISASQKIDIGDYTFTIISKMTYDKYNLVHYTSKKKSDNIIFKCVAYQSQSEIGIWRFYIERLGQFLKGYDYVTSTCLHIELQLFINDNYKKLPVDNEIRVKYFSSNTEFLGNAEIYINDKTRVYHNEIFDCFSNCEAASCFSISERTRKEETQKFVNCVNKIDKDVQYDAIHSENTDTLMKNIYSSITKIMKENFTIEDKPIYIGSYEYQYDEDILYKNKIFKINIKYKKDNSKFTMFYMETEPIDNKKRFKGNFHYLINIIPAESVIDKYGMNSKIVTAGVYIYKPFEYVSQCGLVKSGEEINEVIIPKPESKQKYVCIAYHFENLFPFSEDIIKSFKEGGGGGGDDDGYFSKYMKYKTKYLLLKKELNNK